MEKGCKLHLTRIFAAVPNMQAIRVISESGAAAGPRPARPRGERATVCVCVRATSAATGRGSRAGARVWAR